MVKKIKKKAKKKSTPLKTKPKKKTVKPKKTVKAKKKTQKKKVASKPSKAKSKKSTKTTLSHREKKLLKIKESLIAQRDGLLKEAEMALNALPGEINFPDMGDQATAEANRDFMLRLRDRERMLLKKIKRLEARPVTTCCIDCKTRQEEEERIAEGG
jgi:DnaK suppressor protein